ncbi:ATP-binding protein [Gaetbulibacter sp. M240]|uniref:sensor histidine kinase n=1 Tax=Gaetbulibacter sp. M240 TaxID=3126511 RepID=UPI00374F766B
MKKSRTSFLFFCSLLVNILVLENNKIVSQNLPDSTLFYYNSVKEIKNVSETLDAFKFFENQSRKAQARNDSIQVAYYLELISFGQFKLGLYNDSEASAIKALTFLSEIDSSKVKKPLMRLYNQLGLLYRKIDDYNNSLLFYNKALTLQDDDLKSKIAIITNIANINADQNLFHKAVEILNPYYSEALTLENSNIKANYIDNLGFYQTYAGDEKKGLGNMKLALSIREELNDLTGLFSSYRHHALYHLKKGDKILASNYIEKTKSISNKINSKVYQRETLQLELSLENNPAFNKFVSLTNFLEKEQRLKENKFAAIKYNIAESERKLKESQLQTEKQKQFKFFYFFLGFFLLMVSVFVYFFLKAKNRRDRLLQVYDTEKRISKKIHDEVANDVYRVMSKFQSEYEYQQGLLDDLEIIYNKTRDISKENEAVNFEEDFGTVLVNLFQNYDNKEIQVITKNLSSIVWTSISDLKKAALYRVFQELMTNMKRHSRATLVIFSFEYKQKRINIYYTDNGVGCNLNIGSGLRNVETRIHSVNGIINFESKPGEGFKVKITL